jgi:hypothetical protein
MPVSAEQPSMNRSTDYLERVVVFDRLAAEEGNPEFKSMFEEQAGAYRKVAAHRPKRLGTPRNFKLRRLPRLGCAARHPAYPIARNERGRQLTRPDPSIL